MSIDAKIVEHIANLAHLELDEAHMKRLPDELSRILHLFDRLDAVDTTHVAPLSNPLDLTQPMRPDQVTETLTPADRDQFQQLAPQTEAGFYVVPKVVESE